MKSSCLKCRKNTENIDPKVSATSNCKAMILWKCANVVVKNSHFLKIKNQRGYLGIKTPLSKVPILGGILF